MTASCSSPFISPRRRPTPARATCVSSRATRWILPLPASGASVEIEDGVFKSARVCLASVAPTPLFVREAGEALVGKPVNDESVQEAASIAEEAARPITDMRGTIEYRKHLCNVLTRRALTTAIERASSRELVKEA